MLLRSPAGIFFERPHLVLGRRFGVAAVANEDVAGLDPADVAADAIGDLRRLAVDFDHAGLATARRQNGSGQTRGR